MADVRLNDGNDLAKYRMLCGIHGNSEHYLYHEFSELLQKPETLRFLDGVGFNGFWLRDLQTHEDEWISPGFWRSLGYEPASRVHKTKAWQAIAVREDHEQAQRDLVRHCADPAHPYDQFIRFRTASGDFVTMRSRGFAQREGGHPTRMFGVYTAVGESDAVGLGRLANDIFETLDDAVILWSDRRGIQRWNESARTLYGYGEDEVLGRDPSAILGHTLNAEWDTVCEDIYAGKAWRGALSLRAKSGEMVPARTTVRRAGQIGSETLFVQICRNESALHEAAARHNLVLRELSHRVKNTFSVVNSLILMSARIEGDSPEFAENLRRRISALSQAHAHSLSPSAADCASASKIIETILRAYAVDKNGLVIRGGAEPLAVSQLTPISLLVNELGARASQNGAFAQDGGTVTLDIARTEESWTIVWRESGAAGPVLAASTGAFGTKLISLSATQLGGTLTQEPTPDGTVIALSFPVARAATGSPAQQQPAIAA
ncbi:HWE histidine kinase domain-containing protein [Acuticoccus sp. MNP-M23]|uniref:sensor histidine kinase n=1 Tax=Acuticoccus sp. MNP-M23 TaxID=3072793 RepID=UPI002815F1A4|nr:HWE histidine kinase domain-containing protein [Acuticoccus sp. MNP-M23]WMS43761.1 HWE histidine kinase domain-containing protein [Acuticoccus sp. MNP-M23]